MAWSQHEAIDALKTALRVEQEGRQFYVTASQRASEPTAGETLASLAEDEARHEQYILKELDNISSGTWVRPEQLTESHPVRMAGSFIFPVNPENAADWAERAANDADAMRMAMGMERKSYELYHNAEMNVAEPAGKAFFHFLAEWETNHYKLLQDSYLYLTEPGHTFTIWEGPRLEGDS
jgi:rubrerythrin